jgi:hypothetical protein
MPIISSFTGIAARGFGFTNGLPPLPPTSISFSSISALNAVVTFTTTPTSYPVALVQKKIMQGETLISDWATITSNSNISASNLTPGTDAYTVYFRTQDTGGQISEEVTATLITLGETPPGAPTFSVAPAAGDAGTFKLNITWTAGTIGTYSRTTQYRIETSAGVQLLDWTTVSSSPIAYGADTYNGIGALTPNTTYKVRLKSVAATSETETLAAYQTVTTNNIVAPNAPTSLSAAPVAGTPGEFSFAFSHTPGTARSYPVSGSQYRVRSNNTEPYSYVTGFSTFQQFSGTITIGTSTSVDAIMSPGSTYYVDTRTYDSQGTFSAVTSTSVTLTAKRNPTVGSITVAAPAYNGTNTSTLSVTTSGFTAGSWPISYYQYNLDNGNSYTTLSGNSVGGLTSDTAYTVYVRAVDTQGNASAKANGTATTNAALPPTPTIAWRSMSGSSYGTAQFTVSGNAGSTTTVKIFRRTTSGSNTGAEEFTKATGSQDITTGHASDGGTAYYVAYNYNKHGSQSTASNEIYWTRPQKDVAKTWRGNDAGQEWYFADYTYVIPTNACQTHRLSYRFGPSGIPADSESPGYARVDYMQATFKCGIKPTGHSSFDRNSLCNTGNLLFSHATYVNGSTISGTNDAQPNIGWPSFSTPTLGSSDQVWYRFFYDVGGYGGESLHNRVFFANSAAGKGWNSGCSLSNAGDYFTGKLLELVGVHTISGSGTGF